ncbi:MAG: ABC transporter ATP-binding protein, partial [Anaerolineales bacterium]
MSRLNNDVVGAQRAVTGTLVSIAANVITLVGTLTVMLALEWRLTLLGLVILPLFILPARRVGRTLREIRRRSMELSAEMNASMNETLNVSGALLVKLFGRGAYESGRFASQAAQVRDNGVQSAVVSQWFFLALSVIGAIGTAVVYWVGGYFVLQDRFTIGTIIAFSAYLGQLYGPLMSLTNAPVEFAQSMVSFERVFEALDIPIEITEKPNARPLGVASGRITFDDVSFSYARDPQEGPEGLGDVTRFMGGDRTALLKRGRPKMADGEDRAGIEQPADKRLALHNISFTIEPGQLAALVGPSGAGKTTVTYLIPRLYDPTGGRVCLDGVDIREVT